MAEPNGATAPAENGISPDEIALYDRQIRLWGIKAQEKIRNARILLITIRALGAEVAKNLVLAGIHSLTIVDPGIVTEADFPSFLLSPEHIGLNRASASTAALRQLNPRVRIIPESFDIRTKSDPTYLSSFDIIIATNLDTTSTLLTTLNTAARAAARPFYAGSCHGLYAFLFSDLISHTFIISRALTNRGTALGPESPTRTILAAVPKPDDPRTELVTKRELYSPWPAPLSAPLPADILSHPRRRRAVTPVLSCFTALWAFAALHDRAPNPGSREDLVQFTELASEAHKARGLPSETLRSEVLRSFLQGIGTEVVPATAGLGAMLAQDVIVVLGQNQQPVQNLVVVDGEEIVAPVYALHGPLGV
ncbi:hypothetical protein B0T18DRAFT_433976 [Schizothecium vesticola]|uniref:THIF-type NAD/FAD binding fold domain-containing protein n=1 Tax=Schizothecium vesticola TaxID=314040 RepID=A0AA40F8F2_9PEZI|nr:hypothetical protein B0T18DRAFT_433976 [Schizothecium vesticola]